MPTPRKVLGVSSRQSSRQRRLSSRRTCGVARGTTLQSAAPRKVAPPTNRAACCSASPLNQLAVGMLIWRTTRRWSARPRCVCVLPMSKRRIMFEAILFFHGDVAADDAFEPAVLGAKQQRAVGIERLSAALDFAIADMNDHAMPDGGTMLLPLVRHRLEPAGADPVVIAVEF